MSAWRRIALEKLPELALAIEQAKTPTELWIEIYDHLRWKVYPSGKPDSDLIKRVYEYAWWCLRAPAVPPHLSDAGSAAVVCFFEDLPTDPVMRNDMPNWITKAQFDDLRAAFQYMLTPEDFQALEAEFRTAQSWWK